MGGSIFKSEKSKEKKNGIILYYSRLYEDNVIVYLI
jgi:hypothetical protein